MRSVLVAVSALLAATMVDAQATVMAGVRSEKRDHETVTGCPATELKRYRKIVCTPVLQECELDWCKEYIHTWKLKAGACATLGCGDGAGAGSGAGAGDGAGAGSGTVVSGYPAGSPTPGDSSSSSGDSSASSGDSSSGGRAGRGAPPAL